MRSIFIILLFLSGICQAQQLPCGTYITRQLPSSTAGEFYTRIDSITVIGGDAILTSKLVLTDVLINAADYYNGYLWAWKQYQHLDRTGGGGQTLLKIDRFGNSTQFSFPTLQQQYNAAAIDENGMYYNVESPGTGATSFVLNKINLASSPPASQGTVTINLPANMYWPQEGCGDIRMIGSTMYMYLNQRGLLAINLSTGTAQRLYVNASDTNRIVGCILQDADDVFNLYGYGSNSYTGSGANTLPMQNVLQINMATGAVQTVVANGTQTSQADGASCAAASMFNLTIKGKYFNDKDGNTIINGGEKGIKGPGNNGGNCSGCPALPASYMNLTNAANTVIESVPINQDGSFILFNVPASASGLKLQLSASAYSAGQTVAPFTPAANWVATGENSSGTNSGSGDGTPDFRINIPITPASGTIVQQNFGAERRPETDDKTKNFGAVATNTVYALSDVPLSGSDAEDSPAPGSISNNGDFIITALPPAGKAVLSYNGSPISTLPEGGFTINDYDPALLTVKFLPGLTADGTSFNYATKDQAQQSDQSPATYQLNATPSAPLAITGFQVAGMLIGKNIRLEWKTASENNASHFNIEKSTDGAKFNYAGTTLASGNSTTERKYSFTDFYATPGINYYRIASVDFNQNVIYSNVVVVRLYKNNEASAMYPNPAQDKVHIVVADGDGREIKLIAVNGAVLKQQTLAPGSTEFIMDVNGLTEGVYKMNIINKKTGKAESHWLIIRA